MPSFSYYVYTIYIRIWSNSPSGSCDRGGEGQAVARGVGMSQGPGSGAQDAAGASRERELPHHYSQKVRNRTQLRLNSSSFPLAATNTVLQLLLYSVHTLKTATYTITTYTPMCPIHTRATTWEVACTQPTLARFNTNIHRRNATHN